MAAIDGVGPVGPAGAAVASRVGARSSGFALRAEPASRRRGADPAEGLGAVALGGLLGLQERDNAQDGGRHSAHERDRRARRHGHDMLAALAALQRGLTGAEASGALERLAAVLRVEAAAADPLLGATLAAISLRVRVELARRRIVF